MKQIQVPDAPADHLFALNESAKKMKLTQSEESILALLYKSAAKKESEKPGIVVSAYDKFCRAIDTKTGLAVELAKDKEIAVGKFSAFQGMTGNKSATMLVIVD